MIQVDKEQWGSTELQQLEQTASKALLEGEQVNLRGFHRLENRRSDERHNEIMGVFRRAAKHNSDDNKHYFWNSECQLGDSGDLILSPTNIMGRFDAKPCDESYVVVTG